ncbi:uncharacterized protein LOC108665794 [Hyalella azteca]|uniref:Uncharacterized protein LOC108665794 n=1 Tax=Hyalella azteca TaxID=294128 RepID=A0A8B7N2L1_HYAAZ|nr:uncharacterized protein LOC108665794 [Hyalella azteca]
MKSFTSLSLALLALLASVSSKNIQGAEKAVNFRHFNGYTGASQTGVHYDFLTYNPDLNLIGLDNQIRSACQTGIWMLYENIDYNYLTSGAVCVQPAVGDCFDLSAACFGTVSSLRYAGSDDGLNDNFYNLYEGVSFQGLEYKGNNTSTDVGSLDEKVSSVILSGTERWTFFTGPGFTGGSVCAIPDDQYIGSDGTILNFGLFETLNELSLFDGGIRSLIKGCFSDTVVSAKAVKAKRADQAAARGL